MVKSVRQNFTIARSKSAPRLTALTCPERQAGRLAQRIQQPKMLHYFNNDYHRKRNYFGECGRL